GAGRLEELHLWVDDDEPLERTVRALDHRAYLVGDRIGGAVGEANDRRGAWPEVDPSIKCISFTDADDVAAALHRHAGARGGLRREALDLEACRGSVDRAAGRTIGERVDAGVPPGEVERERQRRLLAQCLLVVE